MLQESGSPHTRCSVGAVRFYEAALSSLFPFCYLSHRPKPPHRRRRCRCRHHARLHISHLLMSVLATFDERVMYEDLRNAYNVVRPFDTMPIPPFEEWSGISPHCSHVYCRCAFSCHPQLFIRVGSIGGDTCVDD